MSEDCAKTGVLNGKEDVEGYADTAKNVDLVLTPDAIEFFLAETKLDSVRAVEQHILKIQSEAAKVFPYPCIRRFDFVKLKVSNLPTYRLFLNTAKEHKGCLFLDVGTCFGTDVRKVVADGFPVRDVICTDIRPEFWEIGHQLYRSTQESLPVKFISGDVLDESFIREGEISYQKAEDIVHREQPTFTSLVPLEGKIGFIHVSNFFHLFTEAEQLHLARSLASLLSPSPGSMIFGAHVSRPEKGFRSEAPPPAPGYLGNRMFCHSAASWIEMWDGEVFAKGTVKVEAKVVEQQREDLVVLDPGVKFYQIVWSVIRL
ncbi:hypothetical protein SCHPADRAFT_823813 [Schizopora paradoxa]|uniref:Methyltransferase domain-containing protein n=1 Tax=Schizopora paradoxa TaxID=27342 RepID=A0A0H2RVD7_9AGAM|nr:hypothetical protein SCHPADRAFT_823813 [Schizopora paradoxa]